MRAVDGERAIVVACSHRAARLTAATAPNVEARPIQTDHSGAAHHTVGLGRSAVDWGTGAAPYPSILRSALRSLTSVMSSSAAVATLAAQLILNTSGFGSTFPSTISTTSHSHSHLFSWLFHGFRLDIGYNCSPQSASISKMALSQAF